MKTYDKLIRFIDDREQVRYNRNRWPDDPSKWAGDPILKQFHFCNINREHDRVTIWIAKNVRSRYPKKCDLTELTIQLLAARIFNDPDVLEEILPFRGGRVLRQQLKDRQAGGRKIFRGAYIMSTNGNAVPSRDYFADLMHRVDARLSLESYSENRTTCSVDPTCLLQTVARRLMTFDGVGEFLANQVCTDLRHVLGLRTYWSDWETFVLAGPGTKRGMNRLHGREVDKPISQAVIGEELKKLRWKLRSRSKLYCLLFEDPNNVANSLCEFDKYCRAQDQVAAGKPMRLKRRFIPNNY